MSKRHGKKSWDKSCDVCGWHTKLSGWTGENGDRHREPVRVCENPDCDTNKIEDTEE